MYTHLHEMIFHIGVMITLYSVCNKYENGNIRPPHPLPPCVNGGGN